MLALTASRASLEFPGFDTNRFKASLNWTRGCELKRNVNTSERCLSWQRRREKGRKYRRILSIFSCLASILILSLPVFRWRTGSDLQRGYRKKVVHLNEIIRNGRLKLKLVKTLNFCISKTTEIGKRGELSIATFRYLKEIFNPSRGKIRICI